MDTVRSLALEGSRGARKFYLLGRESKRLAAAEEALTALDQLAEARPAVQVMRAAVAEGLPDRKLKALQCGLKALSAEVVSQGAPLAGFALAVLEAGQSSGHGRVWQALPREAEVQLLDSIPELSGRQKLEHLAHPVESAAEISERLLGLSDASVARLGTHLVATLPAGDEALDLLNEFLSRHPQAAAVSAGLRRLEEPNPTRAEVALRLLGSDCSAASRRWLADQELPRMKDAGWRGWAEKVGTVTAVKVALQADCSGRPFGLEALAQASQAVLEADPKKFPTVRDLAVERLKSGPPGDLAGAASVVGALVPWGGKPLATALLPELDRRCQTDQEHRAVRGLTQLCQGTYDKNLVEHLDLSVRRGAASLLEKLSLNPGRLGEDRFDQKAVQLLQGGLAAVGQGKRCEGDPLAYLLEGALNGYPLRRPEDYRVAVSAAQAGLNMLQPGASPEMRACLDFLLRADRKLSWNHRGEELIFLRTGLRFLSSYAGLPRLDSLVAVVQKAHPLVSDFEKLAGVAKGPLPEGYERLFGDLVGESLGDLMRSWCQSVEGNCSSVAVIKAAMQQYGRRIFEDLRYEADGSVKVRMHDGYQLTLTQNERNLAERSSHFRGRGEAANLAELAFAAMAKRCAEESILKRGDFAAALENLNTGHSPRHCAELLGMRHNLVSIRPKEAAGHQAVVAWSVEHAIFVRTQDGRTEADHYGRPVQYDGSDTNGHWAYGSFAMAPRPYAREISPMTSSNSP